MKSYPSWGPRRKQVFPDRRWTHDGCHVFKISKSGNIKKRTKFLEWTPESLKMNARKSGHERTKVWWTKKSLDMGTFRLGRSGHTCFRLALQPGLSTREETTTQTYSMISCRYQTSYWEDDDRFKLTGNIYFNYRATQQSCANFKSTQYYYSIDMISTKIFSWAFLIQ